MPGVQLNVSQVQQGRQRQGRALPELLTKLNLNREKESKHKKHEDHEKKHKHRHEHVEDEDSEDSEVSEPLERSRIASRISDILNDTRTEVSDELQRVIEIIGAVRENIQERQYQASERIREEAERQGGRENFLISHEREKRKNQTEEKMANWTGPTVENPGGPADEKIASAPISLVSLDSSEPPALERILVILFAVLVLTGLGSSLALMAIKAARGVGENSVDLQRRIGEKAKLLEETGGFYSIQ